MLCSCTGDKGAISATAALLVLERLLLVISEQAFLRPVLVALLAGSRADIMSATAANMPAWASAGALLRAQDSQSVDYGRQLAAGSADGEEVGGNSMRICLRALVDRRRAATWHHRQHPQLGMQGRA